MKINIFINKQKLSCCYEVSKEMIYELKILANTYIYRSKQFFLTSSVYIMASKSAVENNHKSGKL